MARLCNWCKNTEVTETEWDICLPEPREYCNSCSDYEVQRAGEEYFGTDEFMALFLWNKKLDLKIPLFRNLRVTANG